MLISRKTEGEVPLVVEFGLNYFKEQVEVSAGDSPIRGPPKGGWAGISEDGGPNLPASSAHLFRVSPTP